MNPLLRLALLAFPLDMEHPRGDAALAVLLTVLLIAGRDDWLPNLFPLRAVERVGDWSYSLYLVHWPLLAFAHVAFVGDVPAGVRFGLVLAACVLAWLQWRYVETPLRRPGPSPQRTLGSLLAATAVLVLLAVPAVSRDWGWRGDPGPDWAALRPAVRAGDSFSRSPGGSP